MRRDQATSQVTGVILMVGLVIILALIVFILVLGMLHVLSFTDDLAPSLIEVVLVLHTTPSGSEQDASRVFIQNTHSIEYKNRDLMAEFWKNKKKLYSRIHTLHGEDFIPTQHFGVSTIGGSGCRDEFFSPGEKIEINLKDGYYAPGDVVDLRIYQKSDDNSLTPLTGNPLHQDYFAYWFAENFDSDHMGYRIISQHCFQA